MVVFDWQLRNESKDSKFYPIWKDPDAKKSKTPKLKKETKETNLISSVLNHQIGGGNYKTQNKTIQNKNS